MKSIPFLSLCSFLLLFSSCSKHNAGSSTGTGTGATSSINYTIGWQAVLGGSNSDNANSVIPTKDGGYLAVGSTSSVNSGDVRTNAGSKDWWIIKLDGKGDTLWTKTLGGSGDDIATAAVATTDSGYVVAGYTNSVGGYIDRPQGGYDAWIVKLTSKGDLVWSTSVGGSFDDALLSATASQDGGYVFAGYTSSNDDIISGFHGPAGAAPDMWLVKVDSYGNLLWSKAKGGTKNDEAYSITATADGGYAVAGYTGSTDGDLSGTGHYGASDFCIMKLDATGNITWLKTMGGSGDESANAITTTADGGYLVAGYTNSTNSGWVGTTHGGYDGWMIKLNSTGDTAWTRLLGGSADEWLSSVITTSSGGYAVAGYTKSNNSGDVGTIHGGADLWVVELDNNRNILYQKPIGGSANEMLSANATIIPANGGASGYIVAGVTASTDGDLKGQVRPALQYDNCWILRLQ